MKWGKFPSQMEATYGFVPQRCTTHTAILSILKRRTFYRVYMSENKLGPLFATALINLLQLRWSRGLTDTQIFCGYTEQIMFIFNVDLCDLRSALKSIFWKNLTMMIVKLTSTFYLINAQKHFCGFICSGLLLGAWHSGMPRTFGNVQ